MRKAYLGEFEELVLLTTAVLAGQEAYGVTVANELEQQTGRAVSIAAVHVALHRLLEKGYVRSELGGATATRGGRRKRLFAVTPAGQHVLREMRTTRNRLWDLIPKTAFS
ncbi:Transcriptional regulator PadR-like family protein [Catalinimonas alkaloidigena]|uniref:Transcriptional regulator PadR-like family protein n=1 Tax=Catalinimonas alkaloidigena TaxID=1075417 RepID=A0A1G9G759_9BACT|nr:PadR family transcriptional regulator [Catalinimonas alkaloidigena]SDK96598.1 Transcriptional regulator PadR-like family protein [Catalinimonas alkaloidigena]